MWVVIEEVFIWRKSVTTFENTVKIDAIDFIFQSQPMGQIGTNLIVAPGAFCLTLLSYTFILLKRNFDSFLLLIIYEKL